ncbi:hypothetical protein AB0392_09655 [Nonomuraea angiospora]|uniref:hypothetical protein n=1 Tax=Nonomuraea angiospora TaxID=46172 RepID=UPI0034504FB4
MTSTFAALRLLPMSDRDKDAEILVLRHQITVLERQLGADNPRVRFAPEDRAFLAALREPDLGLPAFHGELTTLGIKVAVHGLGDPQAGRS